MPVYQFLPFPRGIVKCLKQASISWSFNCYCVIQIGSIINVLIFLQNEPCKSQITKGVKEFFKVGGLHNF